MVVGAQEEAGENCRNSSAVSGVADPAPALPLQGAAAAGCLRG